MKFSLKKQFEWSFKFCKNYKTDLLLFFGLEMLALTSSLFFVWLTKLSIDYAIEKAWGNLVFCLIWVVILLMLTFFANLFGNGLNEKTRAKMLIDLQSQVSERYMNLDWNQSEKIHSGDIMMRNIVDCQECAKLLGNSWIISLSLGLRILAAIIMLSVFDPLLGFLFALFLPLSILSNSYFRKLRELNSIIKQQEGELGALFQENFRNKNYITLTNLEAKRREEIIEKQESIFKSKLQLVNFSTFSKGTLGIILQISYLLTFIWGVLKLNSGSITFGLMAAYLQLLSKIQVPFLSLMSNIPILFKTRSAIDRIMGVFQSPLNRERKEIFINSIDRFELKGVSFGYNAFPIFKDINIILKKGIPTALFGASGNGKTTFLNLLMGIFSPSEGTINLGINHKSLPMSSEYKVNISYVGQGDKLLSGSILYNLNVNSATPKIRINEVLELACAEFVYDLPCGLETKIGEGGFGLSEGQAQRIAVARAILQNTQVWLMDEITSGLDNETAKILVNNLIREGKNKIIVFVTHDLSVISLCENRYFIEKNSLIKHEIKNH